MKNDLTGRPAGMSFAPALMDRIEGTLPVTDSRCVRDIVRRDLLSLLNTTNAASFLKAHGYAHLRDSLVNYGMDAIAGTYLSEQGWEAVEAAIRHAILSFEPRLLPDSLVIRPMMAQAQGCQRYHTLQFALSGIVLWQGNHIGICLRSVMDLETAQVDLV